MRLRSSSLSLLATLLACLSAAAAHAKPKLVVLGIEPVDEGDAASQDRTAQLARWMTEELRDRSTRLQEKFETPNVPQRELTEVKLLSNCLNAGNECMAAAGREFGADRLLYGVIERTGNAYSVSLKLLNVQSRTAERTAEGALPRDVNHDQVRRASAAFLSQLTGLPLPAKLVVTVNATTGTLFVGDAATPIVDGTATVDLDGGTYRLAVESTGYRRWEGDVELAPGESQEIPVNLEIAEDAARVPEGRAGRGGGGYRVAFWVSTGLTLALTGTMAYSAFKVKSLETDATGRAEEANLGGAPCSDANRSADMELDGICQDGESQQDLTNYLIGASIAGGLVSTYFLYKGYFADDASSPSSGEQTRRARRSRTLVLPTLTPDSAGLGAVIEF